MGIKTVARQVITYSKNFVKYLLHGGVTYVNVEFTKPNKRYSGKKVFISGGSEGIGRAMALAYLNEGAEVLVTGRSKEKLEMLTQEVNNSNLHYLVWDAMDFDSYKAKFEELISELGSIDVFINNVGGGLLKYERWDKYTPEIIDITYNMNTKSMFMMCQLEGKYMISNKIHGNILNISSIGGFQTRFDPYSISKRCAQGITGSIAQALIKYDIVVNGIAPGTCLTANPALPKGRDFKDNAYLEGQPSHRFTMPEEIATAAMFLTSGEARQIVGYVLPIDGGTCIDETQNIINSCIV